MRIKSILLAVLIAVGFAACNNEETPDVFQKGEATLSIRVMPVSKSSTRAIEDLSDGSATTAPGLADESLIQQLEIYVFNAITENLVTYHSEFDATGVNEVNDIVVSPGSSKIYIVANTNLGTKANINALETSSEDLMVAVSDFLPMSGNSDVVDILPGYNFYGYSQTAIDNSGKTGADINTTDLNGGDPLEIERVVARVAIVAANLDITSAQQLIFDNLKDVEVAMFNVPKASKIFGAAGTLATNTGYLFGEAWPTTANSYVVGTVDGSFKDGVITFPFANDEAPTYYVTENTAVGTSNPKQQMLIVLRGKPHKGSVHVESEGLYTTGGYTYYPIWVNQDGTVSGTTGAGNGKILRNTQYNISLTITGIGNPTIDEVEDAWLDVKVKVKDWDVVTQGYVW